MTNIGIVGAGVAGVHLALHLRKYGIETTLYAERAPEQQFSSRLPALVARVGHTRERERQLGVNHWDHGHSTFSKLKVGVGGEQPMGFVGNAAAEMIAVDMRLYLGRLMEDFAARGGKVVVAAVQNEDLERLSEAHDLLVVATGRGGLTQRFTRIEEHSPFTAPQRWIATGIFHGITPDYDVASFIFAPGMGEIFEFPIYSFEPNAVGLGVEAVPGGPFEAVVRMKYEDDPQAFNAAFLELLREHAPSTYSRIDPERFGLTRPLDLMQGGVTPNVRRNYAQLENGKYALAIGDAHINNDPITGQGANTATYVGELVGAAIASATQFDPAFFEQIAEQVWQYAGPIVSWSNAMLQAPQPQMIELLVAAAQIQEVADAFAGFFEKPGQGWHVMSSQENASEFLAQYGWQGMPTPELVA